MIKYTLHQTVRIKVGQYTGWTGVIHSSYTINDQGKYHVIPFGKATAIEYLPSELEQLDTRN